MSTELESVFYPIQSRRLVFSTMCILLRVTRCLFLDIKSTEACSISGLTLAPIIFVPSLKFLEVKTKAQELIIFLTQCFVLHGQLKCRRITWKKVREKEVLRELWSLLQNLLLLRVDEEIQQHKLSSKAHQLMGRGLLAPNSYKAKWIYRYLPVLIIRQETRACLEAYVKIQKNWFPPPILSALVWFWIIFTGNRAHTLLFQLNNM